MVLALAGRQTVLMKRLVLLVLALYATGCNNKTAVRMESAEAAPTKTAVAEAAPVDEASRPYYRYSVVAGGVYSKAEVAQRMEEDSVVRAHYQEVATGELRPRVNGRDRRVYVSYRVGPNVYWTKNPVLLKQNEMVLTDGENEIRTRCGNRISEDPREPVNAAVEPHEDVFDTKVQKADALFPAEVMAGAATPMGGVMFPAAQTTASVPVMDQALLPGAVAGAPGVAAARGGSGGAGGAGGGGASAGVVPVGADGATWTGFNPYAAGVWVLQNGGVSTFVNNPAAAVYNYTNNVTMGSVSNGGQTSFSNFSTQVVLGGNNVNNSVSTSLVNWTGGQTVNQTQTNNSVNNGGNTSHQSSTSTVNNNSQTAVYNSSSVTNHSTTVINNNGKDCCKLPACDDPQTAVPEPGTMGLVTLATVLAAIWRKWRTVA